MCIKGTYVHGQGGHTAGHGDPREHEVAAPAPVLLALPAVACWGHIHTRLSKSSHKDLLRTWKSLQKTKPTSLRTVTLLLPHFGLCLPIQKKKQKNWSASVVSKGHRRANTNAKVCPRLMLAGFQTPLVLVGSFLCFSQL